MITNDLVSQTPMLDRIILDVKNGTAFTPAGEPLGMVTSVATETDVDKAVIHMTVKLRFPAENIRRIVDNSNTPKNTETRSIKL